MKLPATSLVAAIAALLPSSPCAAAAFVTHHQPSSASSSLPPAFSGQQHRRGSTSGGGTGALFSTAETGESEAEALLRKAQELKAAAAAAEADLHSTLLDKKAKRDEDTDRMIDSLFPPSASEGGEGPLVERLRSKRPSTDMLLRVVERLHEREVEALGLEHVEPSAHHDDTTFRVVKSDVDDAELRRVSGLIDRLVDAAAAVLDAEWLRATDDRHRTHNEAGTAGDVSKILGDKAKDMRREHDEGFKKRQREYYEAARKKDMTELKDRGELKP